MKGTIELQKTGKRRRGRRRRERRGGGESQKEMWDGQRLNNKIP